MELVARDKACEHPDKACHGESCPLARGFYDRLPQARSAALMASSGASGLLDKEALREVALAHDVCPYYLSQELVRWSDVVVGDYNYYFDTSALLHALTRGQPVARQRAGRRGAQPGRTGAQDVFGRTGPGRPGGGARSMRLRRSESRWTACTASGAICRRTRITTRRPPTRCGLTRPTSSRWRCSRRRSAIADDMEANPTRVDAALQRFYFDALHFSRLAESFGAHSLFDITLDAASRPRRATALDHGCASAMWCPRLFWRRALPRPARSRCFPPR